MDNDRWIATPKAHNREANHDRKAYGISAVDRGSWIVAKGYISGRPITPNKPMAYLQRVGVVGLRLKGYINGKPITTTITLKPYPVSSIALQRYVKEGPIASMASGLAARVAEHGTKGAPPRSGC